MTPNLLLVPSARKANKLYSVLPIDGSGDLTFTRASTAIETNGSGLLSSVASGVPRLDYTDSTCPKLLLEPARTNLLLRSQEFDNASWAKSNSTITPNVEAAPDGTSTADLYTSSAVSDYVQQSISVTSGVAYTLSVFVKNGTANSVSLVFTGAAYPSSVVVDYNLLTQSTSIAGSATASVVDYGNGWLRLIATSTAQATGTVVARIVSSSVDAVSTFYLWGAQVEAGSYPTSYIPTTTATATRVVESGSLTGLKANNLIGASEGSIGGEFVASSLTEGSSTSSLQLGITGGRIRFRRSSGSNSFFLFYIDTGVDTLTYSFLQDQNKWLFAWDASGWYLSVNGTIVANGSEVFTFPTDNLSLSGTGGKWELNNLYTYTNKLTEAEAIQKTGFTSYEIMANSLGYTID